MMRLRNILSICLSLAMLAFAATFAQARDITIRGNFTAKNIEKLFQQLHTYRGKTVIMDVKVNVPEKTSRYEARKSHCWVQLIDRKTKRVIEWFNTSDYESGPLTMNFREVWSIQNVGKGERPSHCGEDDENVHAPNPGYIYALNPVG